jgi:hypothetical protein
VDVLRQLGLAGQERGVGEIKGQAGVREVGERGVLGSWQRVLVGEHSSGLKRRLGAINKAGNTYLRTLLISGARSALLGAQRLTLKEPDRLRRWALQVHRLRGHNVAAVALANKLARIVWAVSWLVGPPGASFSATG